MDKIKTQIIEANLYNPLLKGKWGLEKESLRINNKGELSVTPHPEVFGNKLKHPYITTDFSESQIEIITTPKESISEAYYDLENLHDIVYENIEKDELLWPSSMPPIIPEEDKIPIADYGNSCEAIMKMEYRDFIGKRYGKNKQLICGIHYNFSFHDDLLKGLYKQQNNKITYRDFKDSIYLKVARNLLKHQWLITYLMGANVAIHSSYNRGKNIKQFKVGDEYIFPLACSYRSSIYGYRNIEDYRVSFDTLDEAVNDLDKLIRDGSLNSVNEYYSPVRLKNSSDNNSTTYLKKEGIEYLELRMIDLNPLTKVGISKDDLYIIHSFILYSLLSNESSYTPQDQNESYHKGNYIGITGRKLFDKLKIEALDITSKMEQAFKGIINKDSIYCRCLNNIKNKIEDSEKLYSNKIYNEIKEKGFINYHLNIAKANKEDSVSNSFSLKGYSDLELSTQILIKEALLKGYKVEILDRTENFISIDNGDKKEFIKQATKTSLDSYSTALIMENKAITKRILKENGVSVPNGGIYTSKESALEDYNKYINKKIVIKPNNTNFGLGITIIEKDFDFDDYKKGLNLAFNYDKTVLIEEFFPGNEYRFTVIDGEVAGILQRVPANVIGDGKSTIKKLVEIKNENPLRGKGYKTPLEKLKIGEEEIFHLKGQKLTPEYIPKKNEKIFLRENSNISTGGDSIDYTDIIPQDFKNEAIRASKAVGAKITGVDMIISNLNKEWSPENATIIELNFNPAIHIHCYPYIGVNRHLGKKILKALGF